VKVSAILTASFSGRTEGRFIRPRMRGRMNRPSVRLCPAGHYVRLFLRLPLAGSIEGGAANGALRHTTLSRKGSL
jgi:hypothetical protein